MSGPILAGASRRTRQRRRAAITFLLVLGLLGASMYYAMSYIRQGDDKPSPSASETCTKDPRSNAADPKDTTVNVYNATVRPGLAATVAKELRERGFKIGEVANDPQKKRIRSSAHVRYGLVGKAQSLAVGNIVAGHKKALDGRNDTTVDLVLGDAYMGLRPAPDCTPAANA